MGDSHSISHFGHDADSIRNVNAGTIEEGAFYLTGITSQGTHAMESAIAHSTPCAPPSFEAYVPEYSFSTAEPPGQGVLCALPMQFSQPEPPVSWGAGQNASASFGSPETCLAGSYSNLSMDPSWYGRDLDLEQVYSQYPFPLPCQGQTRTNVPFAASTRHMDGPVAHTYLPIFSLFTPLPAFSYPEDQPGSGLDSQAGAEAGHTGTGVMPWLCAEVRHDSSLLPTEPKDNATSIDCSVFVPDVLSGKSNLAEPESQTEFNKTEASTLASVIKNSNQ